MEWILIITLATGPVTVPRPYASEQECIGAGETALPQCVRTADFFNRMEEICSPRRFICVAQPKRVYHGLERLQPRVTEPRK
jgi:hypothetical protein